MVTIKTRLTCKSLVNLADLFWLRNRIGYQFVRVFDQGARSIRYLKKEYREFLDRLYDVQETCSANRCKQNYVQQNHTTFFFFGFYEKKFNSPLFRFRFRLIYFVILQTQETSAKTKSGRCRRGHLCVDGDDIK